MHGSSVLSEFLSIIFSKTGLIIFLVAIAITVLVAWSDYGRKKDEGKKMRESAASNRWHQLYGQRLLIRQALEHTEPDSTEEERYFHAYISLSAEPTELVDLRVYASRYKRKNLSKLLDTELAARAENKALNDSRHFYE